MPKSAAAIAQEISEKESKNKAASKDSEGVVTEGGIKVEEPVAEVREFATGTPFDLVEGRPMVDFYGPLSAYGFVQTPHGEYAIPHGKILRFVYRKEFDVKEGLEVTRAYPQYEAAPQELIDYITPVEAAG